MDRSGGGKNATVLEFTSPNSKYIEKHPMISSDSLLFMMGIEQAFIIFMHGVGTMGILMSPVCALVGDCWRVVGCAPWLPAAQIGDGGTIRTTEEEEFIDDVGDRTSAYRRALVITSLPSSLLTLATLSPSQLIYQSLWWQLREPLLRLMQNEHPLSLLVLKSL